MAKWLGAPVLLVLDCWAMARSAAAMVRGYQSFDEDLNIAGLLLNKVPCAGRLWYTACLRPHGHTLHSRALQRKACTAQQPVPANTAWQAHAEL